MIGGRIVGFLLVSSLSGLAYIKYSQLDGFNKRVQELQEKNELRDYLFTASEESSYFIDRIMDNFENSYNKSHLGKYKQTLLKFSEGKVLETCGGSNRTLKFYPPGTDLTVIDWSPKMVSVGTMRELPTISYKYLVGDVTKMQFQDNSFDTVVDVFGLEHVMEPQKALEEIRRVCKKDGTILLMNQGLSSVVQFHYWENITAGQKLINMGVYVNRNWEKLVKEAGFTVEHLERKKNGKIYIHVLRNNKGGPQPADTAAKN